MLTDLIEITSYTIKEIENDNNKELAFERYHLYVTLNSLSNKMKDIIECLECREIDHTDIHTSFGTPTKKWLYFMNRPIYDFENMKYRYFSQLASVLSADESKNMLSINFTSKELNGSIDKSITITNIDENLIVNIYKFNFIEKDCPGYRHFDTLFGLVQVDINDNMNKTKFIEKLKKDIIIFDDIILKLKDYLINNYCINDLL